MQNASMYLRNFICHTSFVRSYNDRCTNADLIVGLVVVNDKGSRGQPKRRAKKKADQVNKDNNVLISVNVLLQIVRACVRACVRMCLWTGSPCYTKCDPEQIIV